MNTNIDVNSSILSTRELPKAICENDRPLYNTPKRAKSLVENTQSVLKQKFACFRNQKAYRLTEKQRYCGVTTRLPQINRSRMNTVIPQHDAPCINMVSFKVHSDNNSCISTNDENNLNNEDVENSNEVAAGSTSRSNSSTELICRICHEDDAEEKFISPCKCSGSLGVVHKSCLEKWLTEKEERQNRCELCHSDIPVERKPRAFYKYFSGNRKRLRALFIDLFFIFFWIPLVVVSNIYYAKLRQQINENRRKPSMFTPLGKLSNHSIYLNEGFKNRGTLQGKDNSVDVNEPAELIVFAFFNCAVEVILVAWILLSLWENVRKFLQWRKECCIVRVCLP